MRTFNTIANLRTFVRAARQDGKLIGFVPTMGAFHEGHLALMRRARADCDVVITSIFVNPSQFGADEDFERYPRDLTRDSTLAQRASIDALFTPTVDHIYPAGDRTTVDAGDLAHRWEGEARPGHFSGVATVCAKLFQIVDPDRAYFGQKDYQQLKIVERLSMDLFFGHTIIPVPTARDADGIALSSRNAYLSPEDRRSATSLFRALVAANARYVEGERDASVLRGELLCVLEGEPRAKVEYTAIVDTESLEPLDAVTDKAVAMVAARFGTTRLIDNTLLGQTMGKRAENGRAKG